MQASTCCPSHICIETKPEVVIPKIFGLQGCQVLLATCCYISQAIHITIIVHIHLLYQDDQLDPNCRAPFFNQGTCEAIAGIPNSRLGQAALPICLHLTPWQKLNHLGIWEVNSKKTDQIGQSKCVSPSDRPPSDIAVLDDRGTCLRPYKGYESRQKTMVADGAPYCNECCLGPVEQFCFGGMVPEVPRPPSKPTRHLRQIVTADHLQRRCCTPKSLHTHGCPSTDRAPLLICVPCHGSLPHDGTKQNAKAVGCVEIVWRTWQGIAAKMLFPLASLHRPSAVSPFHLPTWNKFKSTSTTSQFPLPASCLRKSGIPPRTWQQA